jgi:hypothetical protein
MVTKKLLAQKRNRKAAKLGSRRNAPVPRARDDWA